MTKEILINKKPEQKSGFNQCGVGGVRTLVQTTIYLAFYMLSLWLIFDWSSDKNTQNFNLDT